ncbi:protein of unknown function (plasmid) [Cupriavidus taiwanensis]|uniref:Uncharacterized protein n=1 Tax=Cupriavidus taiwanensis TaxID=164546 RepID=A0A375EBV5_9BURK|nr:protein of unknown function [Cupriavidus taiwanensis]SOZ72086.1 protein of unknown function [Cupriavidus taiwanensis]SOZ74393.1 protein of unknown function [Cupriavidus taiwanensis]SPA03300.1 protein of unknown function [Cupriavidus taiwanensis]SPA11274.1 protein of unknown function [Cupriavidus taiwanensis]
MHPILALECSTVKKRGRLSTGTKGRVEGWRQLSSFAIWTGKEHTSAALAKSAPRHYRRKALA